MTRKEQHKARKRANKGEYRKVYFGTVYINPLNRHIWRWQVIEVEED